VGLADHAGRRPTGIAGDLAQDRAVRERAVKDVRDINDNSDL